MAEVTSEHRKAAAVAWYHPYGWRHLQVISWIDTGVRNAGIAESLERTAEAIAEACAASSAEVTRLRILAFPPTKLVRGQEDNDDVCTVCGHAVDTTEHTYRDHCIKNLESASKYVHDGLLELNRESAAEISRLQSELGEVERLIESSEEPRQTGGTLGAPTVASAELEADLEALRHAVRWWAGGDEDVTKNGTEGRALSRVEAALGVRL